MGCGGSQPKGDAQQKSPNAEPVAQVKEDQLITRKTMDFKVKVTKSSAEETIGVTFADPTDEKKALHVKTLEEHGAIPSYNVARAPETQILVGDDIAEVNGISGDLDRMTQEVTTATEIILTVVRNVSKSVEPHVIASAVPNEPTSGNPEPAPEKDPESEAAKGEEGALVAAESKDAPPENNPDHELYEGAASSYEGAASSYEGANTDEEAQHQAMVMTDINKDATVDKKDVKEMFKSALAAGDEGINVDPDVGEIGPSATSTRNVCCF